MAGPSSALFGIIDDLYAAMILVTGYGAESSSAATKVYDGPTVTGDAGRQWILIGSDGQVPDAGISERLAGTFGSNAMREEEGTLTVLCHVAGTTDSMKTTRDLCHALVRDVNATFYSLSNVNRSAWLGYVEKVDLKQARDNSAPVVDAVVTLRYHTFVEDGS